MNTYFDFSGVLPSDSFFQDIANHVLWFIGPALYLYVRYYAKEPNTSIVLMNTLPFVLLASCTLMMDWGMVNPIIPFIAFVQMGVYLLLSIRYCWKHYAKARQFYNWILPSILVFAILLGINFSLFLVRAFAAVSIFPNEVLQSLTALLGVPIFFLAYKEMNATNDLGIVPRKYKTSFISEERSKAYLNKIEAAMKEDRFYVNNSATLHSFSQHIDVPAKYISQVVNQNLGMSFSDYLLGYRMNEIKKMLANPSNKNLTIYGMAQEAGFSSASRFNYLFKKHTGQTPREFQKMYEV